MTRTPAVMEIELKPCPVPWCGGEATTDWYDVSGQPHPYWVRCKTCDCKTPMQYATVAEAIAAWNTRTPAEPDGEMIERRIAEEAITAWAYAHNIDGAARNDLFARLRALSAYNPNGRLREALVKARAVLTNSQAESGYCMCGDPVASHSIGSGHSPVDSHIYMAGQVIEEIDAVLSHKD